MKRARLIVMAIAILAAAGAAILAKGLLKPKVVREVRTKFDTVEVLVARAPIGLGSPIQAKDLRWQSWPRAAAGPASGFVTKHKMPSAISELSGAIARSSFAKGEPIKKSRLIQRNKIKTVGGALAAILPAGMRAISVPIREETAAGGFILPDDRVDVIVTVKIRSPDGRSEQHMSDTLFTNVRVLAIGQEIETKEDKKVVTGKTATLELTATQAERMALAQSMGEISLTLRSLADTGLKGSNGKLLNKKPRSSGKLQVLRYGVTARVTGIQ